MFAGWIFPPPLTTASRSALDGDGQFRVEAFSSRNYLWDASASGRSMEGLYFGKKGDRVDAFALNLTCAARPYRVAASGSSTTRTIVADIVTRDCPTPNHASNDSGLGGRSDILGEVKTIQPGKSSYRKGNCQANPPANHQRASNVRRNYRKRTVDLDRAHAPEVIGDGTNGQVGPFEEALGQFHTGNVFPIVAGAFGEVNHEDASKLVTNLARLTAKTDFGKSMSPLYSQPQQERRCLPNHAVTVQACPRLPNSQGAGTAPPQTEALRQTLRTGGIPNSGRQP
ncbi:hypothetical protein THAOC_15518 [Thalassiosira oceanica]|uniref:Uncharacterized protein n=1 Tax=Thalassiosira oceanica TaxID=159749 RepID=K0SFM8_THAOC|nr:hypothetical protein THAOC_15518 [Thalassiosira oceanica]|eukprot:EJK63809.1 hypothetical protein THAOC_15518 [Thalassiosira oceanica]